MCVIMKESELHHSIGSLIDGAHPGRRPIEIIWAVTTTKLRHPPTTTSLSLPYITLLLDDYC